MTSRKGPAPRCPQCARLRVPQGAIACAYCATDELPLLREEVSRLRRAVGQYQRVIRQLREGAKCSA